MSQENVEVVRAVFDAWNRGGLADMAPLLAEDVEWLEVMGRPEAPGVAQRGRSRLESSLESLFDAWEQYRLEPQEVRECGDDRVVAVVREVARGRESKLEVASDWGYLVTVRGRKVTRVEAYRDPAQALEAAERGG